MNLSEKYIVLIIIFLGQYARRCTVNEQSYEFANITMDGDYIIDFVLSIHEGNRPDEDTDISVDNVVAVEAIISAIEYINADASLLSNVSLGYVIHDDYNSVQQVSAIAMKLSQRILSNSLLTSGHQLCPNKSNGCSQSEANFSIVTESHSFSNVNITQSTDSDNKLSNENDMEFSEKNYYNDDTKDASISQKPVVAVVGSSTSDTTVSLAMNLQLLGIPIVGCMATSNIFQRWLYFPNFIRVVPSDKFQAQAIFDIIVYFEWSYIFVLTSNNYYGLEGLLLLENEAAKQNVCLNSLSIQAHRNSSIDEKSIRNALDKLNEDDRIKVVIVFMLPGEAQKLFLEVSRKNITGITWIASEAWAGRGEFLTLPPHIMQGIIGVTLNSQTLKRPDEYPVKIHPRRNKWLLPFLCQQYNIAADCSLKKLQNISDFPHNLTSFHDCFPVSLNFIWTYMFDAIYTIAKGLHNLLEVKKCENKSVPTINYSELLQNYKDIRFQGFSAVPIQFDRYGQEVNARYDIITLQFNESIKKLEYINIGSWQQINSDTSLTINPSDIHWNKGVKPMSRCSVPCGKGYKRKIGSQSCCWVCEKCPPGWVSTSNISYKCLQCEYLKHPNDDNSECVDDKRTWFSYDSPGGIIIILLCSVGELFSVTLLLLFSKHRNHHLYIGMSFKFLSFLVATFGFLLPFTFLQRHLDIICHSNIICLQLFYALHLSLMFYSVGTIRHYVGHLNRLFKNIPLKGKNKKDKSNEMNHITFNTDTKCCSLNCINMGSFVFILTILLRISPLAFNGLQMPAQVVIKKVSTNNIFLYCRSKDWDFYFALLYEAIMLCLILLFSNKSRNSTSNNDIYQNGSTIYDNDKIIYYEAFLIALVCFTFTPFERFESKPRIATILQSTAVIIIQYIFVASTYGTKLYVIYRERNKRK